MHLTWQNIEYWVVQSEATKISHKGAGGTGAVAKSTGRSVRGKGSSNSGTEGRSSGLRKTGMLSTENRQRRRRIHDPVSHLFENYSSDFREPSKTVIKTYMIPLGLPNYICYRFTTLNRNL